MPYAVAREYFLQLSRFPHWSEFISIFISSTMTLRYDFWCQLKTYFFFGQNDNTFCPSSSWVCLAFVCLALEVLKWEGKKQDACYTWPECIKIVNQGNQIRLKREAISLYIFTITRINWNICNFSPYYINSHQE